MRISITKKPPVGAAPGTLAMPHDGVPPRMRVIRYGPGTLVELEVAEVSALDTVPREGHVTWLDVQGLGDEAVLRALADRFSIHPLALEDIVHVPQRPKSESYPGHQLLITRMVHLRDDAEVDVEQVAMVLRDGVLVTFQERHGDVFDPVRRRLRSGTAKISSAGADYLAYALIDTLIDGYFPVMENLGEELAGLEGEILENAGGHHLRQISQLRYDLLTLRRSLWPHRDVLDALLRTEQGFFSSDTRLYLRDTYDHTMQLVEVLESYREMASTLLSTYHSVLGQRANDVMRVLTVMASIFIPLTFLVGVYGMNFRVMPELDVPWAYPALWAIMILVGGGLFAFFLKKGWIGSSQE